MLTSSSDATVRSFLFFVGFVVEDYCRRIRLHISDSCNSCHSWIVRRLSAFPCRPPSPPVPALFPCAVFSFSMVISAAFLPRPRFAPASTCLSPAPCHLPPADCPGVLSDRSTLRVPHSALARAPHLLTLPPCHEEGKSSVRSVREGRNRLEPFALRFDLGLPTGGRQRPHDRAAASASSHGENELRSRLDVAIWRRWSGPGTHFRNRGGTTVRTVRITHLVNANVSLTSGYVVCWCGQSSLFQLSATVRNCPQLSATVRNCPH